MKFICDSMLGKLAKHLRILGLDAEYMNAPGTLNRFNGQPNPPYFLTRTLRNTPYKKVVIIKSDTARAQLLEIKEIIRPYINPNTIMNRCIECNVELVDVKKNDIEQKIPEFVFHQYEQFRKCSKCGKVYWEGSHATNMAQLVREIIE